MSFQLGPKVLIINDPAQAPLLFFAKLASGVRRLVETDDDFQTTTAFDDLAASPDTQSGAEGAGYLPATVATDETIAQADLLRISGFGDFVGSEISEVVGVKGILGQKEISTITFTIAAPVAGTEAIVNIEFRADDLRGEFASHLSDYKRKKQFPLVIKAGETVTTLATRLKEQINSVIDSGWASWITVTSALGVVTVTSTDPKITILVTSEGSAVAAGTVTVAHAITTPGYSGRNSYEQLKGLRLETVLGEYVEEFKAKQIPIRGAKYSSYLIKKSVSRPDLKGGTSGAINTTPVGAFEFLIYINESTASAYLTDLIKWLNANVARRIMYSAVTAADAIAAENPTPTTVVDSSEPFTTGLS